MSRKPLTWHCLGPGAGWCPQLEGLLPGVGEALGLGSDFSRITICAEDAPGEESCWFRISPPAGAADGRPHLEMFCSTRSFAPRRSMKSTVVPARQIWDAREGAWLGDDFAAHDFSIAQAEIFLYHNLLLAQDLVRDSVSLSSIPVGQIEAFEAAWEVGVDGRLARAGLPGFTLADRRGIFSSLFSSAGVLMPDHWQIFQSLWDGGLTSGRDVLAIIRQLPRL